MSAVIIHVHILIGNVVLEHLFLLGMSIVRTIILVRNVCGQNICIGWKYVYLQDHGLLEKVEEQQQYLSSAERRQKHGERKRLGELKREQRKESKKRKVLKLEDDVCIQKTFKCCCFLMDILFMKKAACINYK